jgi:hypothetical protein
MSATKSASIKAIELTRAVFESIHGNLGLLKFNIEELKSVDGSGGEESKKWEITCNFFETLGSTIPSHYKVVVDLNNNSVTIKKLDEGDTGSERRYVVREETGE